jgi:AraC-like DNA-binding protein
MPVGRTPSTDYLEGAAPAVKRETLSAAPLDIYSERPPLPRLRNLVACSWTSLTVPSGAHSFEIDVVPDACMDIMWSSDGVLSVAGPDTRPYRFRRARPIRHVGLRFEPGVAPAVLGVAASELRDQRVELADIWGRGRAERVADALAAATPEQAEIILQQAVEQRLVEVDASPPDELVQALVAKLTHARASVAAAAHELGISERHLRRRCEVAIGYGPKTLDRVLRFQRFRRLAERRGGPLAQLAVESGYADQAHLSREHLRLAGTTPARATTISLAV